ncbi:peptidoglycan DD-metalloendopeptidase family protein [Syntrophomonas erecta subsp. sporosyntropha]
MGEFLRQKKLLPVAGAVIVVLLISLVWTNVIRTPAYMVCVDGKEKFAVKHKQEVEKVLNRLKLEQEKQFNQPLELNNTVEYKRVFVGREQLVVSSRMETELKKALDFKTMAAAIVVNDKDIAYLGSRKDALELLEQLKKENSQLDEGEKLVSLGFEEKVQVKERKAPASKVISTDKAYSLITTGTNNPETYEVQEGDSLWMIARKNDMYVDEILKANRLKSEDLKPGEKLILVKSKPYVNVIARVEGEKIETIPFETKVVVDRNAYSSVRVTQSGQNGEKKIVYEAIKRNGVLDKREIKEEQIIKEAVNKILVKGSQVNIASRGGGARVLDWPVYGPISSYYGSRGGSHTGIDIAARSGTAIRAAASGNVTYAGYQGGYGKFIIVNHGNGIVSRYAHCSSINVSVGQRVAAGQTIGTVGSTGRSTGPHLHFEVLAGGSFRNPLSYLR